MDKYICYKITNTLNGKGYIGQTSASLTRRWDRHLISALTRQSLHLIHRAIRKCGKDAFVVVELGSASTPHEIGDLERKLIVEHNTYYGNNRGYNMTWGGEGTNGYVLTEEARQKMSDAQKGKKRGPRSEKDKKTISDAKKALGQGPSLYCNQRRSETGRGVPRPQHVRDKIRRTLTGRKRPAEVIAKVRATKRRKRNENS